MADLNWKWVLGFAIIAILLYRAVPAAMLIPSQAILNVEQDKQATMAFQIQVAQRDSDLSDNNYTLQEGSYKIVSSNGSTILVGGTTNVDGIYNVVVNYAPTVNSSVVAEILEKVYIQNETCTCTSPPGQACIQVCTNTSILVGQNILATQKIDINVVPAQSQASPVVVTTSGGYYQPISSNTPVTPTSNLTPPTQDILVPAQETFWTKYGLLIVLSISFIVLGFALLNYFGKGKTRRRR